MGKRFVLLLAIFTALLAQAAHADVRSDAVRLLAQRVRQSGVDPKNIAISGVTVSGNQAVLSWDSGKQHGVMGLVLSADRWWDALDMTNYGGRWFTLRSYPLTPAAAYPDDVAIHPKGGTIHPPVRSFTSGYDITITYAANDAAPNVKPAQLFARAPTLAEFAPSHAPAPGFGGPDAVCFFDLQIAGTKPVTFARGTSIDIWFPFVLDDQLRYNLTFFSADKPSGMIFGTIFDNTLHFVLPQFTLVPDKPLMAEIDGDPKGSS